MPLVTRRNSGPQPPVQVNHAQHKDRLNFKWKDPRMVPDVGVIIGGFKVKVRDMKFAAVN